MKYNEPKKWMFDLIEAYYEVMYELPCIINGLHIIRCKVSTFCEV